MGIILYEMIFGFTPFFDRNKNKVYDNILRKTLMFPSQTAASHSQQVRGLIENLLIRNPSERLGASGGYQQILSHEFFDDLDLQALEGRRIEPPFEMESLARQNSEQLRGTELEMSIVPKAAVRNVMNNQDKFAGFES